MAMTLRTKGFDFVTEGAFEGWKWNEIHDWDQWRSESGVYYALSAAYALVSFAALVQLIRIQRRVPEYGWTTQKVFHFMIVVVSAMRAIIFGLHRSVYFIRPKAMEEVIMNVPTVVFFSTFTLLVLFWAEIYYQARSLPAHTLRPTYFIINALVYFIQICIWIYMSISKTAVGAEAAKVFLAVISFCAALGFLIYGGRLFVLLRCFPVESRGRQNKIYEVCSVTCICCTCFLIRCVMLAFCALDKDTDLNVLDHPIMNLFYYMLAEIIPSALVLFILRKVPPRRVSDQYQPIR